MRWDDLFADLTAQLTEAQWAEQAADLADRTRAEAAGLHLVDRLRPLVGARCALAVRTGETVDGLLLDVGAEWALLAESSPRQALVPLAAVVAVSGAARRTSPPGSEGVVGRRLRLGYALRALARDRSPVALTLLDGATRSGTLDRVGADFVELAVHPPGEPRRPAAVGGVLVVPFSALVVLRSG